MPGTYSPVADFKGNRYLQTVMHVGIAYPRWQGKRSRHSRRMRTHNCTYLARCGCQKQQNSYVNHLHQTSPEANWIFVTRTLQWRHNEHHGVSNHCCLDSLLGRLFRRRLKKTSKLPVTSFCEGSLPVTDGFPSQRASNTENVSVCRHHEELIFQMMKKLWYYVYPLCCFIQDTSSYLTGTPNFLILNEAQFSS